MNNALLIAKAEVEAEDAFANIKLNKKGELDKNSKGAWINNTIRAFREAGATNMVDKWYDEAYYLAHELSNKLTK